MKYYSKEFYLALQERAIQSAQTIVPMVIELIQPSSLIDIGCGNGAWISIFRENGIEDVIGIDGEWVKPEMLLFPAEKFISGDLKKPLRVNRQFDLVVSLEVAEHLPPKSAETFIDSLTRLGIVILFSAAIPFQGGTNHLNEQWPSYWTALFFSKGYVAVDCLRGRIWDNDQIDWWYAQNIMFFVREDQIEKYPLLKAEYEKQHSGIFSAMHPKAVMERQRHLKDVYQHKAELTKRVKVLKKECSGLKKQGEDLLERVAVLTKEREDLSQSQSTLLERVALLKKERDDLSQSQSTLLDHVDVLTKEREDLRQSQSTLLEHVAILTKERDDLSRSESTLLEWTTALSKNEVKLKNLIEDLKILKPGKVSLRSVLRGLPALIFHAIKSRIWPR